MFSADLFNRIGFGHYDIVVLPIERGAGLQMLVLSTG